MSLNAVIFNSEDKKRVRACLVSFDNNADKSQGNHLERILQKPFTIFPKSTTLIEPTKRTFNNPTLWNNRKGVQFIAFYDLNLSFRNSFYFIGKILSCIASVNKNFFYKRKIIGYIAIIVNHINCTVSVGNISGCNHYCMRKPKNIHANVQFYS